MIAGFLEVTAFLTLLFGPPPALIVVCAVLIHWGVNWFRAGRRPGWGGTFWLSAGLANLVAGYGFFRGGFIHKDPEDVCRDMALGVPLRPTYVPLSNLCTRSDGSTIDLVPPLVNELVNELVVVLLVVALVSVVGRASACAGLRGGAPA